MARNTVYNDKIEWTRILRAVKEAANFWGVAIPPGNLLLVWDHAGHCRAYSATTHNVHWRVSELFAMYEHASIVVEL